MLLSTIYDSCVRRLGILFARLILLQQKILSEKGGVSMKQMKFDFPLPEKHVIRFVAYITVKGRRLYASAYGKRAWPILVKV